MMTSSQLPRTEMIALTDISQDGRGLYFLEVRCPACGTLLGKTFAMIGRQLAENYEQVRLAAGELPRGAVLCGQRFFRWSTRRARKARSSLSWSRCVSFIRRSSSGLANGMGTPSTSTRSTCRLASS